jgi:hypothetical protein
MSGLATIAWVENVIGAALAASPVEHELDPSSPFAPFVRFEDGALAMVTRHPAGFVRMMMATEAGRIVITDLSPHDAATAGLLLTGNSLEGF